MEPLLCYECGSPLSDTWDAFVYMRDILDKQNYTADVTDDKRFIDENQNVKLLPIFKALYIERICCRKTYLTSRNIHNF
jgi:DNA-directed RNA polymerase subunit N (RpoN/RPB10)